MNIDGYTPRPGYMLAAHWLRADMRAGHGKEKAWTIGEERIHKARKLVICELGYHSSPSLWDGLQYAPGPMAIAARQTELTIWGETRTAWEPSVSDGTRSHVLGLQPSAQDALRFASHLRDLIERHGWEVGVDYDRRANSPSRPNVSWNPL